MADDTHGGTSAKVHRSSRQVALEKNESKNFEEGPPYDIKAGHPITKDMPMQEYKGMEQKSGGSAKPMDIPAPFTIKGA